MNRKQQIEARLAEIRGILTGDKECDVAALEKEVRDLQAEKTEIETREKRETIAKELQDGKVEGRSVEKPADEIEKPDLSEKRGKDFLL
jgi:hypothetical protein